MRYLDDGPVRGWDGWDHIKQRLEDFHFKVMVDGYELRKPILLPTSEDLALQGDDFKVYPFAHNAMDELGLTLQGYIFHQRKQLSPPELQGLLVRIRNVGITGYESDLLGYPRNLGPMVGGMTGEIYVDAGLEDALNIDRNSFNETDRHFVRLKEFVFAYLGVPQKSGITTDIRKRSSNRQKALQEDKTVQHLERLARRLRRSLSGSWQLRVDTSIDSPLDLDMTTEEVRFNLDHDTVPGNKTAKLEFFRLCLVARLAEALGPPEGEEDALVGWLRNI